MRSFRLHLCQCMPCQRPQDEWLHFQIFLDLTMLFHMPSLRQQDQKWQWHGVWLSKCSSCLVKSSVHAWQLHYLWWGIYQGACTLQLFFFLLICHQSELPICPSLAQIDHLCWDLLIATIQSPRQCLSLSYRDFWAPSLQQVLWRWVAQGASWDSPALAQLLCRMWSVLFLLLMVSLCWDQNYPNTSAQLHFPLPWGRGDVTVVILCCSVNGGDDLSLEYDIKCPNR